MQSKIVSDYTRAEQLVERMKEVDTHNDLAVLKYHRPHKNKLYIELASAGFLELVFDDRTGDLIAFDLTRD